MKPPMEENIAVIDPPKKMSTTTPLSIWKRIDDDRKALARQLHVKESRISLGDVLTKYTEIVPPFSNGESPPKPSHNGRRKS